MFGPGTSEAQDVNGVYVFQLDKDRIPQLGNDDSIRDYNILNKLEILRQLGIQKNPDTSTEVRPGLFHYPDSTYSRTDHGDITLKYLLDGVKKLTVDVRGRSTLMVPPDEALVIPLTCRILEGAPREGEPLVSPTSSQFSQTSSTPQDDFDDLFGGGGGKTRRHKLTKKYRLRSRSRTRSKPKSTKKRGIK